MWPKEIIVTQEIEAIYAKLKDRFPQRPLADLKYWELMAFVHELDKERERLVARIVLFLAV